MIKNPDGKFLERFGVGKPRNLLEIQLIARNTCRLIFPVKIKNYQGRIKIGEGVGGGGGGKQESNTEFIHSFSRPYSDTDFPSPCCTNIFQRNIFPAVISSASGSGVKEINWFLEISSKYIDFSLSPPKISATF